MNRSRMLLTSLMVLIFIQSLRVVFSNLFGIIYDQIFEGPMSAWLPISAALVLLALFAPGLLARRSTDQRMKLMAVIATMARIAVTVDDATIRYWGGLIVLAAAGSFMALVLGHDRRRFSQALVWGVLGEYLLRVAGDTFDLSLHDGALPYVLAAGLLIIILALRYENGDADLPSREQGLTWSLALSLGAFVFLQTSLLALPAAVARYSSVPYAPLAVILFLVSGAILIPGAQRMVNELLALRRLRLAAVALITLGFLAGYFTSGWAAAAGLVVAQGLVIAGMAYALRSNTSTTGYSPWRFGVGLLAMLTLNFLNAFAFTYPYTLPLMREKGWVVYIVAIAVFGWAVIQPDSDEFPQHERGTSRAGIMLLAGLAVTLVAVWPRAALPLPEDSLRLATWNMHYGFDDAWHTNMQEMVAVIAAEGVDVIALQEVDAGRLTSYSSDNAYFLARRLGMQTVYLPAVEHLTGIALLYKGPLMPSNVTYLSSLQEQTGLVHASLDWGSGGLDAYGIWMGLSDEDTLRQIDEALKEIGDASTASFGGDFNAHPDDPEIEAVRASGFADPFDLLGVENPPSTSPAIDPEGRIDFVWLRGLIPLRAWVSESLASDHRMVIVEVSAP